MAVFALAEGAARVPLAGMPLVILCAAGSGAAVALRHRRPLPALVIFLAVYAVEAAALGLAEQLTALGVWALTVGACAASGRRSFAIAAGVGALLPLELFHLAEPRRAWLEFAPATLGMVGLAWANGYRRGGRPARLPEGATGGFGSPAAAARLRKLSER